MQFEVRVALRHLKSGGWQTILTISAVAVAVVVVIFVTSLIRGVQERFFGDLIGSIPHVTVKPPEPEPQPLMHVPFLKGNTRSNGSNSVINPIISTRIETQAEQRKNIQDVATLKVQLQHLPGVKTVVANVTGQAFLLRGSKRFGLTVSGSHPYEEDSISHLQEDIVTGKWLSIEPDDIVIGYKLADKAKLVVGDRVRIQSSEGVNRAFTVAGIYDTGLDVNDLTLAHTTLRDAQGLFSMEQSISSFWIKVDDPYKANDVADKIMDALPYRAESWMREQAEILDALRVQNSTSNLISAFSLFASMLGIASVLIVSVIQKSKQIGILKSMGARSRQILLIFTLEGLGIAIMGAVSGALLSYGLLIYLLQLKREVRVGKIDQLFPIIIDAKIFTAAIVAAIVATVIAALLPAQRAAKLNPVEVIRGG